MGGMWVTTFQNGLFFDTRSFNDFCGKVRALVGDGGCGWARERFGCRRPRPFNRDADGVGAGGWVRAGTDRGRDGGRPEGSGGAGSALKRRSESSKGWEERSGPFATSRCTLAMRGVGPRAWPVPGGTLNGVKWGNAETGLQTGSWSPSSPSGNPGWSARDVSP